MRGFIPILMMLISGSAAAAPSGLNNYYDLIATMRSYGIEPSRLQWTPIETMCMGLRAQGEATYNACRLEKGLHQVAFRDDSESCNAESFVFYPKSTTRPRSTDIITSNEIIRIKQSGLLPSDARTGRRFIFDRCMRDRGWRSPRDWRLGMLN